MNKTLPEAGIGDEGGESNGTPDAQREWRGIFEEFLRVKGECGEPVESLTYEKFEGTLRKNRDAIVSRHGVERVKFTVYVKDGKAALKASPIRD